MCALHGGGRTHGGGRMHGEIWDFPGPLPESMKVNDGELARVERCTRIVINTKVQLFDRAEIVGCKWG